MTNAPAIAEEKKPDVAETKAPAVQAVLPKQEMSKGEKWYNWIVYKGINYWVNLIASLAIADYFINRKGRARMDKWATGLGKLFSKGVKEGPAFEKNYHHAKTALETAILSSGGWLLLIPMKWMEDRKRKAVHWFNKKLGVDQRAPDGHELTPDEIHIEQEQPEQSWWRVVGRRLLGQAAVIAAGHGISGLFRDRTKPMPLKGEPDLHGGKNVVTNTVVDLANKGFTSGYFPGGKWLAKNERAQAWLNLAVLDSFLTWITASVMWITNGAKKKQIPNEATGTPAMPLADVPVQENSTTQDTLEKFKRVKPQAAGSYVERALASPQPELQAGI